MTRKKEAPPPPPKLTFKLPPELWKQIVAIGLIALGIVILLSLVTGNRGSVTDTLLTAIRLLVGWGVLLAPIWLGAIGLYLFLDSLNRIPNIGLERPIGAALLYVVALALIHLIVKSVTAFKDQDLAMNGGGWLGEGLANLLSGAVGEAGAYV